jgi:hypothetical protein
MEHGLLQRDVLQPKLPLFRKNGFGLCRKIDLSQTTTSTYKKKLAHSEKRLKSFLTLKELLNVFYIYLKK